MTMTAETTLYEILGVAPSASAAEIKTAYRRVLQQVHPDHGGTSALLRQVRDAYEVLSDPTRRASYDRSRAPRADPQRPQQAPGPDRSAGDRHTDAGRSDSGQSGASRPGPGPSSSSQTPPGARYYQSAPPPPPRHGLRSIPAYYPTALVALIGAAFAGLALLLSGSLAGYGDLAGLVGFPGVVVGLLGLTAHFDGGRRLSCQAAVNSMKAMGQPEFRSMLVRVLQRQGYDTSGYKPSDPGQMIVRGDYGTIVVWRTERHRITRSTVARASRTREKLGVAGVMLVGAGRATEGAVRSANAKHVDLWDRDILGIELLSFAGLPTSTGWALLRAEIEVGVPRTFGAMSHAAHSIVEVFRP